MKFLKKRWQKITFWIICSYLVFGILMAGFLVSFDFGEYGLSEIEKYYHCSGTRSEVAWCLFFQNLTSSDMRLMLVVFPYLLIKNALLSLF